MFVKPLQNRKAIITVTVSAVNLNNRTVVCLEAVSCSCVVCKIVDNVGREKDCYVKGNLQTILFWWTIWFDFTIQSLSNLHLSCLLR